MRHTGNWVRTSARLVAILVIVLCLGLASLFLTRYMSLLFTSDSVDELVQAGLEQYNSHLPQMLNTDQRLERISLSSNIIIYRITLVHLSAQAFRQADLDRSELIPKCVNLPAPFLREGFFVRFLYFSNDGKQVASFMQNPIACDESTEENQ